MSHIKLFYIPDSICWNLKKKKRTRFSSVSELLNFSVSCNRDVSLQIWHAFALSITSDFYLIKSSLFTKAINLDLFPSFCLYAVIYNWN